MCKDATEIQKTWEKSFGDFVCVRLRKRATTVDMLDRDKNTGGAYQKKCFWLPRQDQLQELLNQILIADDMWWEELTPDRKLFYFNSYVRLRHATVPNMTFEQLWLSFIMKNIYNKVWGETCWRLCTL